MSRHAPPPGATRRTPEGLSTILGAMLVCMTWACEPDAPPPVIPSNEPKAVESGPELAFPDELRVTDKAVNDFLDHAMRLGASGNYDEFRLLWSARDEPLSRAEYDEGWQAVRTIRIRALERVQLASGDGPAPPTVDPVYAAYAEVELDPTQKAGKREARRKVICMLVQEHGEWRLARAPKPLREWLRTKVEGPPPAPGATQPTPQPTP